MNSKDLIDYARPKLGSTQKQYDALLRILNSGAKPEDVAEFLGMGTTPQVPQTNWQLSAKSIDRLKGVDKRLVMIVNRAIQISKYDFMVVEGLRTKETQAKYVKEGKSKTMNSYHLTGHAVDLAPLENGDIDWNNSKKQFNAVADAMMQAAKELGYTIEWGGNWKSFIDMPHFQIAR